MNIKLLTLTSLFVIVSGQQIFASETDQFLTVHESLKDSTNELNERFNKKMKEVLKKVNDKDNGESVNCEKLTDKIMKKFRFLLIHRIEYWAQHNLEVFPPHTVSNSEYMSMSIHDNGKRFNSKKIVPLARTLQVQGVNFGTDKLGHFVSLGHKYFKKYRKFLKKNLSDLEAQRKAVLYGIEQEKGWIGAKISGVRSYADLEANYRGMLFAKSLCHDKNPRVEKKQKGWVLVRPMNIEKYVNPYWDESFNNSTYTEKKWQKVAKNLKKYCSLITQDGEIDRLIPYENIPESLNMKLIKEEEKKGEIPPQENFSLSKACES